MPQWNIKVSKALDEAVNEAVRCGRYSSKAELIRSSVRKELERMGITNTKVK